MTQEEKQLLLKDLCGRLPYGVLCDYVYHIGHPQKLLSISLNEKYQIHLDSDEYVFCSGKSYGPSVMMIQDCRPYLRPMSSMTMEEQREYISVGRSMSPDNPSVLADWLNAHHFDYCGLIEKGLALEAPEGMYKQ